MDIEKKTPRANPILIASPISKLLLIWIWPLFKTGFRDTLKKDDIYDAPPEDTASKISETLEERWNENLKKAAGGSKPQTKPSMTNGGIDIEKQPEPNEAKCKKDPLSYGMLLKSLVSTFGLQYFSIWPVMVFNDCFLRVIQPLFLLLLIRSFLQEPKDPVAQYLYAAGVCVSTLTLTLTNNPCLLHIGRLGMRIRIGLTSLIQRKMMRLSQEDLKTNSGQLVNLVSNDASRLEETILYIPYLLIGPLQLLIFMYFLWEEFGVSSLAGVAFILFFMPFQYWNGSMSTKFRGAIGKRTDERARDLTETICGMHAIKMYAWEDVFKDKIKSCRKLEVNELRKRSSLHAFYMSIFLTSSRMVPFLTFLTFVLQGGPLTADRVFYAIAVYNTATHYLGFFVPSAIRGIGEILGSLNRIQRFLLLEEKSDKPGYSHDKRQCLIPHVALDSATARWSDGDFYLNNLDLAVDGDKVVVIVGPVGSGKAVGIGLIFTTKLQSSLLQLLLAELPLRIGSCGINGRMSYASQVPWVFDGSVKQNIIFTEKWDEVKFWKVIKAAALQEDLNQMPKKEMTIVGDRGVALSGGQRARVNLARALYRDADIYLLDDPLSAVDSRVSRHIFDECINGYLEGRLRILVTHQHQYLPKADHIVIIENGRITDQGTYEELSRKEIDFMNFGGNSENDVDSLVAVGPDARVGPFSNESVDGEEIDGEEQSEGSVGLSVYWKYFKAGDSPSQFSFYFFLFVLSQIFTTIIEYWLAMWTNAEERSLEAISKSGYEKVFNGNEVQNVPDEHNYTGNSHDLLEAASNYLTNLNNLDIGQRTYLWVYGILIGAVFVTNLAKAIGFFRYCMRICSRVHEKMLSSLMRAQPKFFDRNPSGRILNRFTKDIGVIDDAIPLSFFDMLTIFLQIATVMFLIVLANWYTFFPMLVFLVGLWFIRRYYVATSRDLKRIDGTTRSPVFTHLTASFNGLATIRASEAENKLSVQFDCLQDIHTASAFLFLASTRCFDIWVETIATFFLALVTFSFLLAQDYLGMSFLGGNVGLAICSAMSLTMWLQYGMRTSANVENLMISVERSLEYTKLKPEKSLEIDEKKPKLEWPHQGNIIFRNVTMSYSERGPRVLDNLSFEVRSGEKVGIVGRTGAGKSSILRALYRMTEPSTGTMVIDGIVINDIGLHDLRKNISVIPQDPALFRGTMRFNLDPTGLSLENDMKSALDNVQLGKPLDFEVSDGGSNFSVGERQLLSLARALLRKKKIYAIDEATAHVDPSTDANIQKALRNKLANCTVMTIAHRLDTVIDSDRILVMNDGHVKEFDSPHLLLQNPQSALSAMVNSTGLETAIQLRDQAKTAYENKAKKWSTLADKEQQRG